MVKDFLDFINSNKLCDKTDKILVTVSGGVDSVVLAMLFKDAGFDFAIAHCNFHLRGDESNADEAFVIKLAKTINTKFFVESFDAKNYAALHNVSIQMAARGLRYEWFSQLREQHSFDYIATAHHLNDSLETVLFNLTKGTGIAGLRGILPKQNRIIRPMLFAAKDDILKFAQTQGLTWKEDSSNVMLKYNRNLIRHKVIPLLKKINPALESTFSNTRERLTETADILKRQADEMTARYAFSKGKDIYISREGIKNGNVVLTEELLKPYGFTFFQAREIFTAVHSVEAIGKRFSSDHYQLNIDRENIIISPVMQQINDRLIIQDDKEVVNEVLKLNFNITENTAHLHTQKDAASLDFDRLRFPLKLRKWQAGDIFQPLGMKGKKKLSDFMIDEKIPLNLKERVCVLESDGQLVWIIGYRIDDRFKVNSDTKKVFNIVISGNDQSL